MPTNGDNLKLSYAANTGELMVAGIEQGNKVDACLNDYFYHQWYPTCYHTTTVRDDMKVAFNIAKKLMDTKLIQCKTVKQFIDLVDMIIKEL